MSPVDLRSDTVTQPTPRMREAMYQAEVGDDVYGEDPTVNRLEKLAADRLGKEAAVFVASGTMGNLVSLLTHSRRGEEVIVGDQAHILHNEMAGAAGLGGIQLRTVPNDDRGRIDPSDVRSMLRPASGFYPRTALVCMENTHNRCHGATLSPEEIRPIADVAHAAGVALHVDGARIFNASVALRIDVAELVRDADSVQFCFSKGLSAPVGSMIVGSGEFIARARKYRKIVGGGMRQVGVIAAAAIVALEEMVDRLTEDHDNAQLLVRGLASIPGMEVHPELMQSNILYFGVRAMSISDFQIRLAERGVLVGPGRMVTHYGVSRTDIELVLESVKAVLAPVPRALAG